jgi:hypothetical protein
MLRLAVEDSRAFISGNHDDFKLLHDLIVTAQGKHPGILIVRRDNNAKKDMSPSGITRALHKLLKTEIPLENGLHILNHWR